MEPETQYATLGKRQVAYKLVGEGPIDLLVPTPGYLPIDLMWEEPSLVAFIERLANFSRVIWFDTWGLGASDPLPRTDARVMESGADEMIGMLDALDIPSSAVLDFGGGRVGLLFAATYPQRCRALIADSAGARFAAAPDYPEGLSESEVEQRLASVGNLWGTGGLVRYLAPSQADDARFVRWLARCERLSYTPTHASWQYRNGYHVDLRSVLSTITTPTLVMARPGTHTNAQARYVADHVPGARFRETPGEHMIFAGNSRHILDAIEEFLTGQLPEPDIDRVLATIVFTDLVNSTGEAARLGDKPWRQLRSTHDSLIRAELQRYRGNEVKSLGDGFLATFDGPGRAIRCASAIRDAIQGLGVDIRIGVHTGEIELQSSDVGGIAVHIAQRVMSEAQPGEIVVSSTVRDLVAGSGIRFEDRGTRELRGVPEAWRLFAATV